MGMYPYHYVGIGIKFDKSIFREETDEEEFIDHYFPWDKENKFKDLEWVYDCDGYGYIMLVLNKDVSDYGSDGLMIKETSLDSMQYYANEFLEQVNQLPLAKAITLNDVMLVHGAFVR